MGKHSPEYEKYIRSREWQQKRLAALRRVLNRCEVCGIQKHRESLEVHHKTYERLGNELDSDLMVVCKGCHPKEDRKRVERTYDRRLNAWATKVYGEDWYENPGEEAADEAFREWLERKAEREGYEY